MIKTGIKSGAYFSLEDYASGFEKIHSHGYDCVDLGLSDPTIALYKLSDAEHDGYLKDVAQCAKANGVEIFQVHGLWSWDMVVDTPEKRLRQAEFYKKQLRGTAILGCKNMVIHPCMPCGWWGSAENHDEILERQMEELSAILPTAEQYGITVCLENMPLGISTTAFIKELVQTANHQLVKACFDTGHAHLQKENVHDSLLLLGSDLRVLHIHDNNGQLDLHLPPYMGNIDWDSFVQALQSIEYKGCISLETGINTNMPQPMKEKMQIALSDTARHFAKQL